MKLNPDLATELDYFRLLRRQRVLTKREFEREKKKIEDRQERLDIAERSRRLQAEFARREAEKKRKAAEARALKREERRVRRNTVFNRVMGDNPIPDLIDAWKASAQFGVLRAITPGFDFEIMHTLQSKDFVRQFYLNGGSEAGFKFNEGDRLVIVAPTTLSALKLRQMFRDGIEHCVFVPILKRLTDAIGTTDSKDRKKRLAQRIAKINELKELYDSGVPEEKMEDVAKASGYKIVVHNIIGTEIRVFNEHGRCGVIKFTNTRPNHVDVGHVTLDQDFEIVDQKTICDLWKTAQRNGDFYMIEGDIKEGYPRRLKLLEKAYRVQDENEELFEFMNRDMDLHRYRFNATKYPEVNEFIKAGRIINSWVCPFSDITPTGHLDMPKAYAQFEECDWYRGFLGVIHQWRSGPFDRKWIEDHIGIYQVRILNVNEDQLFWHLGIRSGTHILPSPEILYFMDKGMDCEVLAGVWGSRMDFAFEEEMLNDRRYCLWSGRLGMERKTRNFSFSASEDWASHLKSEFGDDCYYWEDKKICSVRVPIKNVMTTHHILAFITSYVRIQMMEAMSKFDVSQLVRVVMDGIYFVGEKPQGLEWFKEKELKETHQSGFEWYSDESSSYSFPPLIVAGNTLLTGQGGAGKTYKILTDKGFNRVLFVTPQHVLGEDVRKTYDVGYTTIHKLIGVDCRPYLDEHPYPPVLFIDEITQISAEWIEAVFKMYSDSLILLAGDINASGQWFQCRNGSPNDFSKIWTPFGVDVVCVQGDRRSRDDALRTLKLRVRNLMERIFRDGDSGEEVVMKVWAKNALNLVKFDDAVKMFETGDVWIAGTHKTNAKLLENGICSGWYKRGGRVEFEEKEGYEKRGSFTVHAFQGRTVDKGKIFISVHDLFEYSMLYTALSRAVHFDQLVFVEA